MWPTIFNRPLRACPLLPHLSPPITHREAMAKFDATYRELSPAGAGPTLACGTGACALTVAAVLAGKAERTCTVTLPGGDLQIEWREANNRIYK